jgi:hypothetical protein
MSTDRESTSREKKSLDDEFQEALEQAKKRHGWKNLKELRLGERLQAVVLFGSLTTREPKQQDGKLKTDADILLLYDGTGKPLYRSDPRGNTDQDYGPFSEHIPNADIMVMNVTTLLKLAETAKRSINGELRNLLKALEPGSHSRSTYFLIPDNSELATSFIGHLDEYMKMPEMILTGKTLEGKIPDEVVDAARSVFELYNDVVAQMRRLSEQHK